MDSTVPMSLPQSFDTIYTGRPSPAGGTSYDSLHWTEQECIATLKSPVARKILGHDDTDQESSVLDDLKNGQLAFTEFVERRVNDLFSQHDGSPQDLEILRSRVLCVGYAALLLFVQANITGPPLSIRSADVVFPTGWGKDTSVTRTLRETIIRGLSVDGAAIYRLTPVIELFSVAKTILRSEKLMPPIGDTPIVVLTGRMRLNFLWQKMLSENVEALQATIFQDLVAIGRQVTAKTGKVATEKRARFYLESAAIQTHHGLDDQARRSLESAARENGFEFALTGRLGKRTKFQDRDISQLVVLAKSKESEGEPSKPSSAPKKLDLNDDTLLESISFNYDERLTYGEKAMTVKDESSLPPELAALDPANQPKLDPLDSIVLLGLASAIKNTNPEDGLTREETLPYATRVLEGGSSNWQVYSQALLVRSRIEGYRSRTVERGVLQLQALVDQVIADTTNDSEGSEDQPTTFLPRAEGSESAPAHQRLEYVWLLSYVTRWELEAELAARWIDLGGLRTALDIYERLEMWAETALCYAVTDRENKAKLIIRKQLFEPSPSGGESDEEERFEGPERSPLPIDAPRLFCILGDLEKKHVMYERAWEVSNARYSRAQRSLARYYMAQSPPMYDKAEDAFKLSLGINRLNHSAWFQLGCLQLERCKWQDAVESFTRTVQLEDTNAEAWSNLAVALLNVPAPRPRIPPSITGALARDIANIVGDPNKPKRDALNALRRAARLKRTDYRIWQNIMSIGESIPSPNTPYKDLVEAQQRVIELQGAKDGENCIGLSVIASLVHVLRVFNFESACEGSEDRDPGDKTRVCSNKLSPGTLPAQIVNLIDNHVSPLITHSTELWQHVADVDLWRKRPSRALAAREKAWRATIADCATAAFQMADKANWLTVATATNGLVCSGYITLGPMKKEVQDLVPEGEGTGEKKEPELVAPDWKFKARSALRGIMGKAKEHWEDSLEYRMLKQLAQDIDAGTLLRSYDGSYLPFVRKPEGFP